MRYVLPKRPLRERTLSKRVTWMQDVAPQRPRWTSPWSTRTTKTPTSLCAPQRMTAEDVERLALTVGERCNGRLLNPGFREVCSAFLPSKKACGARHFGT